MTEDQSFLQNLVHEVIGFFEFVEPGMAFGLARQALIRDLGGTADLTGGAPQFPTAPMESIKAYRDAANPDLEADLEVVRDIAVVLDAIASNVETWQLGAAQGGQELGHSLLELLATNWARHRVPRVFMFLQAIAALEDATSTFGAGDSSGERLGRAFASIGKFLASPGKTLDDLDAANDKLALSTGTETLDIGVDTAMRLAATVMGVLDGKYQIGLIGDTLVGWDAPGLDIDSAVTPTRADVISSRMISFSIAHDSDDPADENKDAERLQVSLLYLPKRSRIPADQNHRQLFVAFGGALRLDAPINKRWTFTVNLRSDAGIAVLIGHGLKNSDFSGLGGDGNFVASVGWTSKADESTGLSYAIPHATGTRLEIGTLAFSLALASSGAEVRAEFADCALVIDGSDNDGFMHTLLGGTPVRLPFTVVVGYNSATGRILEAHLPQSGGGTGSAVQNSPLAGSGTDYAPIFAATIPLGRRFGPVTIHEIALRVSHAQPATGGSDVTAVEADISFSAQIGAVYFRVDRLGLAMLADKSKPPAERNLRFLDVHLGISPPLGIAVSVDTGPVSGGGVIFHDPVQGIYFGALSLADRNPVPTQSDRPGVDEECGRHAGVVVHRHRHVGRARLTIGPVVPRRSGRALRVGAHFRRDRDARGPAHGAAAQRVVPRRPGAPSHRDHAVAHDVLPRQAGQLSGRADGQADLRPHADRPPRPCAHLPMGRKRFEAVDRPRPAELDPARRGRARRPDQPRRGRHL